MKTGLILGFFDGIHAGHRSVIQSALDCADKTILITFKESPAVYFSKNTEYIMTREDSIKKIKQIGVSEVISLDFSKIAKMTAGEYLEFLISDFSPAYISTGFNHTFGLNKEGTPEYLRINQDKYNYKYLCVEPVIRDGEIISSSKIREQIINGNIESANKLLESNFSISGKVIRGKQIGRTIGFPTANIIYPERIVHLPFGVYKTNVSLNDSKKYNAIMNWGIKPTLNNTLEPITETHILNFNGDLYNQEIKIEIIKHIRGEIKFNSLNELQTQITKDINACLE